MHCCEIQKQQAKKYELNTSTKEDVQGLIVDAHSTR
jgi:hypothetical protein